MTTARGTHHSYLRLSLPTVVWLLPLVALGLLAVGSPSARAEPEPADMWFGAAAPPRTGVSFYVSGGVKVADDLTGQSVSIHKREMGENSDTFVAEVPLIQSIVDNMFSATLPGLTHSAILTATWTGNSGYLPSNRWTFVPVRAQVTMATPRVTAKFMRLRATIRPLQPLDAPAFIGAKRTLVLFQRRVNGTWKSIGMGDTMSTDAQSWVSSTYYGLKPGRYVLRARFVGTDYNSAAVSKAVRVTVP